MSETKSSGITVQWISSRIEFTSTDDEMERVFFKGSDNNKYYFNLDVGNRSSELVAISLVKDAFLYERSLNIWWESRNNRRWIKAVNIY